MAAILSRPPPSPLPFLLQLCSETDRDVKSGKLTLLCDSPQIALSSQFASENVYLKIPCVICLPFVNQKYSACYYHHTLGTHTFVIFLRKFGQITNILIMWFCNIFKSTSSSVLAKIGITMS